MLRTIKSIFWKKWSLVIIGLNINGTHCCFGYNLSLLGELVNVSVRVNEK